MAQLYDEVRARLSSQNDKHTKLLFGATGFQSGGLTVLSSFLSIANLN